MQLILVSGLSGAGKTTALKILEDNDCLSIDNLPPPLLIKLITIYANIQTVDKIAIGIDIRMHNLLDGLPNDIALLKSMTNIDLKIIFLDAKTEILIKRFSETRRKHPLANQNRTITDCIAIERISLAPLLEISHHIDSSNLNAHDLKIIIKQLTQYNNSGLTVVVQSFSFKHGVPIDSDFMFDVRCLPNPYYDNKLRNLNGLDIDVINFFIDSSKTQTMITDIYNFLKKYLYEFNSNNRPYITISIGCTGGVRRSVYVTHQLSQLISALNYTVLVRHSQITQK